MLYYNLYANASTVEGVMDMKVVVLAGGLSDERNVSLSSGVMVASALRKRGHEVALIDLFLGMEGREGSLEEQFQTPLPEEWIRVSRTAPDLEEIRASRKDQSKSQFGPGVLELCRMADIVFLALHGACGEDGRIQATLETLGIPFTGTGFLAAAIAMDKDLTKKVVIPAGVKTPAWEKVAYRREDIPAIVERTGLPVVVKPLSSGSSVGVSIANTKEELEKALEVCIPLGGNVVLEQYIKGREIQVAYLVDRALPSIEIIPKKGFYDYENKYQPGASEEITPAPIPAEWEARLAEATQRAFRAVGMAVYARADFIVTEDGTPWFLEINTLPGMTPTSLVPQEAAVVGLDYGDLCETILQESLRIRG